MKGTWLCKRCKSSGSDIIDSLQLGAPVPLTVLFSFITTARVVSVWDRQRGMHGLGFLDFKAANSSVLRLDFPRSLLGCFFSSAAYCSYKCELEFQSEGNQVRVREGD